MRASQTNKPGTAGSNNGRKTHHNHHHHHHKKHDEIIRQTVRRTGVTYTEKAKSPKRELIVNNDDDDLLAIARKNLAERHVPKHELDQQLDIEIVNLKLPSDLHLKLPNGIIQRPMTTHQHAHKQKDEVATKLLGLPGDLALDENTTQKYFGLKSREKFFERYHQLSKQQSITHLPLDHEIGSVYIANDSDRDVNKEIPFAPRRRLDNSSAETFLLASRSKLGQSGQAPLSFDEFQAKYMNPDSDRKSRSNSDDGHNEDDHNPIDTNADVNHIMEPETGVDTALNHDDQSCHLERRDSEHNALATTEHDQEHNFLEPSMVESFVTNSMFASSHCSDHPGKNLRVDTNHEYDDFSQASDIYGLPHIPTLALDATDDNKSTSTLSDMFAFASRVSNCDEEDYSKIISPRSRYINACMRQKVNPRASLLLRKSFSKRLDLQHQSMGDEMAALLAESISGIPYIQAINVADNRLTDKGLSPIVSAVVTIRDLLVLDLSENKIGPDAAKALSNYLQLSSCPLQQLILRKADVDDFECVRFIDAIKLNHSLRELDLSNNMVGSAENLNTVMPDVITGGEALADLFRSKSCKLRSLNLSWNMVRLGGAVDLASSLAVNTTLTSLDLSYNSLSREGGVALGEALVDNKTLVSLSIADNAIEATACFTICAAIFENKVLRKLNLDGNPIGELGSKALMMVPALVGSRVKISAARCNVSIKDKNDAFDFIKLIKDYTLNMEDGFERAIASVLLILVAGHHTYIFKSVTLEVPNKKGGNTRMQNLHITQTVEEHSLNDLDSSQKEVVQGLLRLKQASGDITMAIRLFQDIDKDGSGQLDHEELGELMSSIGIEMSERRLKEVIAMYDIDKEGKIEVSEFLMFLKAQNAEATTRLNDILHVPIFGTKDSSGKIVKFRCPRHGILHLSVRDGFSRKSTHRVLSSCDKGYIQEVARSAGGEFVTMMSHGLNGAKLRLDEGLAIFRIMSNETRDIIKILTKLLPQMSDARDARQLLMHAVQNDRAELLRLKREMGAALKPITGHPNGYYVLDLTKNMDRLCLIRLLELSKTMADRKQNQNDPAFINVGDYSQKGNFSCFRNERFNGNPLTIDPTFATPMPASGRLEFDFFGNERPDKDDYTLTDLKFVSLLVKHFLVAPRQMGCMVNLLKKQTRACDRLVECTGKNIYVHSESRCAKIAATMNQFYENLGIRSSLYYTGLEADLNNKVNSNLISVEAPPGFTQTFAATLASATGGNSSGTMNHASSGSMRVGQVSLYDDDLDDEDDEDVGAKDLIYLMQSPNKRKGYSGGMFDDDDDSDSESGSSDSDSDGGDDDAGDGLDDEDDMEDDVNVPDGPRKTMAPSAVMLAQQQDLSTSQRAKRAPGLPTIPQESKDSDDSDNSVPGVGMVEKTRGTVHRAALFVAGHTNEGEESDESSQGSEGPVNTMAVKNRQRLDISAMQQVANRVRGSSTDIESGDNHTAATTSSKSVAKLRTAVDTGTSFYQAPAGSSQVYIRNKTVIESRARVLKNLHHMEKHGADDFLQKFRAMLASPASQLGSIARRYVDIMEELLGQAWFCARHLALLIQQFRTIGKCKHSKYFGTYRVDLIIALLERVVDLHNLDLVFRLLSPYEIGTLYCRVGILNLFNPMKPDGSWDLDLTRREERTIGKVLCCLAVNEPGDNWIKKSFQWQRDMDPMPGWELTQPWMTEDGMPMRGILKVTYYSGDGTGKLGCKPNVLYRKSLLNLVLIDEAEVVEEDFRNKPVQAHKLPGKNYMKSNPVLWSEYLAPKVDPNRKR